MKILDEMTARYVVKNSKKLSFRIDEDGHILVDFYAKGDSRSMEKKYSGYVTSVFREDLNVQFSAQKPEAP